MKSSLILVVLIVLAFADEIGLAFQSSDGSVSSGRVVGGEDASPHAAPYIVSLQLAGFGHFCGGFILTQLHVVTAAHCFSPSITTVEVVAGAHNLSAVESSRQVRTSVSIIKHENYTGIGPFDIGIVKVNQSFVWNTQVQATTIPLDSYTPSGFGIIYGWGSTSNTTTLSTPSILQTAELPILDYETCEYYIGSPPYAESNICTGPLAGGMSSCRGDSGGPLIQIFNGITPAVVGIVSYGTFPCGQPNNPTVYTRASFYIQWITNAILNN